MIESGTITLTVPISLWSVTDAVYGVTDDVYGVLVTLTLTEGCGECGGYNEMDTALQGETIQFEQLYPGTYELSIDPGTFEGVHYYPVRERIGLMEGNILYPITLIPMSQPTDIEFYDEDEEAGTMAGTLIWEAPYEGEEGINEYRLYFEDEEGNRLGDSLIHQGSGQSNYVVHLDNVLVPSNAEKLRLYTWDGTVEMPTAAIVSVWDVPIAMLQNPQMTDTDLTSNRVAGVIQWERALDASLIENYVILVEDTHDPSGIVGFRLRYVFLHPSILHFYRSY